jgi:hypothetical protein
MNGVLQHRLAVLPWMDPLAARLPGVQPCPPDQWLLRDEAFNGQVQYRDRLVASNSADVIRSPPDAEPAARGLLDAVLAHLKNDAGYTRDGEHMIRPDGARIALDDEPLRVAARLVQQDLLLLAPEGGEHRLVAAVVCFPASWTLSQKIGRSMTAIHSPVARYDASIAKRTERIIASLRPGEPVWRANVLPYNDPELRQPRLEGEHRPFDPALPTFIRVERQTLLRLSPASVAFAIHTGIVPLENVPPDAVEALKQTPFWASQA